MRNSLIVALGIVTLACAGCGTAKAPTASVVPDDNHQAAAEAKTQPMVQAPATATIVEPEAVTAAASSSAVATDAVPQTPAAASTATFEIDDTWQTYSNKSLGFEFRWPTKGTYAPHWSVDVYQPGDTAVKDGCVVDINNVSKSEYKGFCHTISQNDSGEMPRTDYFSIKNGKQYAVITFTKQLYATPDTCKTNGITATQNSCRLFVPEDYEALLETIMATFKYSE
jgi:hypothetical protein